MRLVRIGLDAPVLFGLGMVTMHRLAAEVLTGGENAIVLAQAQATLATGEQSPDTATPHVDQPRAGGTTYFGPGVLLAAPVVLAEPRVLHEALLNAGTATCAEYGVQAVRRPLHPGLWVCDDAGWRKVASIGLAHRGVVVAGGGGLSLNVSPDLSVFDAFDACGIDGVRMTSLAAETGRELSVAEVADTLAGHLARVVAPVLLERRTKAAS